MIRREKVPANVRVVTGDGQILNHCKALGVRTELPSRMFDQTPQKLARPLLPVTPNNFLPPAKTTSPAGIKNKLDYARESGKISPKR